MRDTAADRGPTTTVTRPTRVGDIAGILARVAFAVAVVLSPFRARVVLADRDRPPIYGDYTDFLLFWSDAAALATLALWGISLLARRPTAPAGGSARLGPAFLRWPVLLLLAVAWSGVATSVSPALSAHAAIRLTIGVAFAVYVYCEVRSPASLLPVVATTVAIQAVVGVGQVLSQRSIGWRALGEHELDPIVGGVSVVGTPDGGRLLRAYGLADHPNILGGVLVFALVVLAASLTGSRDLVRAGASVVFALGVLAATLTFSRAAGLALVVAFGVAAVLAFITDHRAALRWWAFAAAVGVAMVLLVLEPYGQYFESRTSPALVASVVTESRSLTERQALVELTNDLIIDRPFTGTGIGATTIAMQEAVPDLEFDYQPAHVVLLVVAGETGIVGALAYSAILATPWVALWLRRDRIDPPLIGATALLAAVTIVGWFDYYTWTYASGQFWFWLTIGLWAGAYERAGAVR